MNRHLIRAVTAAAVSIFAAFPVSGEVKSTTTAAARIDEHMTEFEDVEAVSQGKVFNNTDYTVFQTPDTGNVSFEKAERGYSFTWEDIEKASLFIGKEYKGLVDSESSTVRVTIETEFTPRGNSFHGIYLNMEQPGAECYIVEGWGDWRPPSYKEVCRRGTYKVDEKKYDLYETCRDPYEDGEKEQFTQYWAVACESDCRNNTTNFIIDKVNVSSHLRKWESLGADVGDFRDCYYFINAYRSRGSALVKNVTIEDRISYATTAAVTQPVTITTTTAAASDGDWDAKSRFENFGRCSGYDYNVFGCNGNQPAIDDISYKNTGNNGFEASWEDIEDVELRKGLRFKKAIAAENIEKLTVDYDLEFEFPDYPSYIYTGVCCTESSGNQVLTIREVGAGYERYSNGRYKYEVNGVKYALSQSINYRYIDDSGVPCLVCLRLDDGFKSGKNIKCSNSIDVKAHLEAIRKAGFKVPEITSCEVYIEAYDNPASVKLNSLSVTSEFKDGVKDMDNEACPAVIYGDINEDGRLDSLDYVTYRKAVLEEFKVTRYNEYYRKCADIDGDGKITVTDMVRVGLYLIGKSRQVCFDDTESSFTEGKRYYSEYFKNSVGYSNCTSDKLNIMNCTLNHTDDACFENGVILDASRPVYELDSLKAIYYMKLQVPTTQAGFEFGIHGSFVDSDDEFYIAEASHRSSRFRDIEPSACFESDGYTYDIYMLPKEKTKNGKTVKYTEYWSVLRNLSENSYDEVFVENCADIIDHINAWTDVSGKQICQLTAEKVGWFWRAFNADYAVVHLNSFDVIEK